MEGEGGKGGWKEGRERGMDGEVEGEGWKEGGREGEKMQNMGIGKR